MFHTPVVTSTANAGQATWLNRPAAVVVTWAPSPRSAGTGAARVSCPPTQIVAASTCRNSRTVVQEITSMPADQSFRLLAAVAGTPVSRAGRGRPACRVWR